MENVDIECWRAYEKVDIHAPWVEGRCFKGQLANIYQNL